MTSFQHLVAQMTTTAPTSAPASGTNPPFWVDFFRSPLMLAAIMLAVFFILTTKNRRSQDKQRQDMLSQLKRGDRIQTTGGILGTVVEAREDEVVVKVDESSNTKIRFARGSIYKVLDGEKPQQPSK